VVIPIFTITVDVFIDLETQKVAANKVGTIVAEFFLQNTWHTNDYDPRISI